MYKNYVDLLKHILVECEYIETVITPKISFQQMMDDETLKRAIVRSLDYYIVWDVVKNIIPEIRVQIERVVFAEDKENK